MGLGFGVQGFGISGFGVWDFGFGFKVALLC